MKRESLNRCLPRCGASALIGLAIVCAALPAYAGWNPFTAGTPIDVGPKSGQIAIADFNGDGHGDILANHSLDGRASLLLGDGHGEFPLASRTTIAFGYDAAALAVGDVNGDQRPDLVIVSLDGATATMHVLMNSVDGRFKELKDSSFPVGKIGESGWKPTLALADVNGDKKLDLISANGRQNTVDVFYGSGVGQFFPGQIVTAAEGFGRYSHVVGDLNGDGRADMVVAAANPSGDAAGKLTVLLGNAKGELIVSPELSQDVPAGAQVKTLADINGDKLSDIVLTHGKSSATALLQSKDGKLAASSGSPFDIGHEAFGMAAIPVGYAGNDVLVAATVDSLDVVFAENGGEFQHACFTPMPAGPGAYHLGAGDLNGDGKPDVVANSFEGNALSVLLTN